MSLKQYAAQSFHIELSPAQLEQFDVYAHELADWNTRVNLTGITDPEAVQVRHFLDSLSLVQTITAQQGSRLMDIGTGAGFPGLPLAMVLSDRYVTLMESTGKKITFLDHIIKSLGLSNARTLRARAEEAGQQVEHREVYDIVTARAVARLPILAEYMLPLAKIGGMCIAMKGQSAHDEVKQARRAIEILGGKFSRIEMVQLPGVADPHHLVIIQKIAPTPKQFPRRPGLPTQKPL